MVFHFSPIEDQSSLTALELVETQYCCINWILEMNFQEDYKSVHTMNGRPEYSQLKGSVERGDAIFKECQNDCKEENLTES
jgi:hypothetical protein